MRSLPILLPAAVIHARACPLASIRQIRTWRVSFVEHGPHEGGARPPGWPEVVEVEAAPRDGRPGTDPVTGAPCWPTDLHGEGFTAAWAAPRRVQGRVRLRGEFVVDPLDGRPTTGRILRLRLVTETVGADGALALRARDLSAVPKSVDVGDGPRRDRGVLLDLELGVGGAR